MHGTVIFEYFLIVFVVYLTTLPVIELTNRVMENDELEICGSKWSWPILRHCPDRFPEGRRETTITTKASLQLVVVPNSNIQIRLEPTSSVQLI
jgi:hypothetical protein